MNLNIEKIEQAIEDGWVTKRKHPEADLYILNYSPAAQIEFHWDKDTTMICRGLIVDDEWNVVARPFQKFFTIDQLTTLRNKVYHLYGLKFKTMFDGPFRVFDKLDGSLGVLYPVGDKVAVATRGSFESEMAIKGTQMLPGS
jgi:RNA ligase